ncbi:mCG1033067, partial [Mus musculus]
ATDAFQQSPLGLEDPNLQNNHSVMNFDVRSEPPETVGFLEEYLMCSDEQPQEPRGYLCHCSFAVRRHHDHCTSYKGKHLIGAALQFQRFSPLLSWQETWQHAGGHGAAGGDESCTSGSTGSRKRTG